MRFVLTATPWYLLVAIKVPKWFNKAIDNIRKGFCGKEKKNKFTEAVAWLLGKKYADQSTLGAWECINLKSWDELYT